MIDPVQTILSFNAGRDPERLAMKYRAMRADPFVFLRGTCRLFYQRLHEQLGPPIALAEAGAGLTSGPAAWACGDLHLQNFGSYKGDNRLAYFDINDFDEGALAPALWDPLRLLCSVMVARDVMRISRDNALVLCGVFCDAYREALGQGKPRWVDRDDSQGLVRELLDSLRERKRVDFLDRRTVMIDGAGSGSGRSGGSRAGDGAASGPVRRLRLPPAGKPVVSLDPLPKALPIAPADDDKVRRFMVDFAASQPDPTFFRVLDVARRVAGTGSLGVERYVLLVQGKGSPDRNYLLDLKRAMPSSLDPYLPVLAPTSQPADARTDAQTEAPATSPAWPDPAHRVVELQRRMQAASMAFLHPVTVAGAPFVLRALQPSEDRVTFSDPTPSLAQLKGLLITMGRLVAWAQLRSAGRDGAASVQELIQFGAGGRKWQRGLDQAVAACEAQTRADWQRYAQAFDDGAVVPAAV